MATAADLMLQRILVRVVSDSLLVTSQQASLAGLDLNLMPGREGLEIYLGGYDDKLPLLLQKVARVLANPPLDKAGFDLARETVRQALRREQQATVTEQGYKGLLGSLFTPYYTPAQQMAVLEKLTLADLRAYAKAYFSTIAATLFVHGNLSEPQARSLAADFRHLVLANSRLVALPDNKPSLPEPGPPSHRKLVVEQPDSAWIQIFIDDDTSPAAHGRWLLLGRLMAQPFYTELRTRQQLGYAISASHIDLQGYPALLLMVQSGNTKARAIGHRVHTFLERFSKQLSGSNGNDLSGLKSSLVAELRAPDQSLAARGEHFYDSIIRHLPFDIRDQVASAVDKTTAAELRNLMEHQLLAAPRSQVVSVPGHIAAAGSSLRKSGSTNSGSPAATTK